MFLLKTLQKWGGLCLIVMGLALLVPIVFLAMLTADSDP